MRQKNRARTVLDALLEAQPDVDGALITGERTRRPKHRFIHILRTRENGPDAGAICRTFGGGGTARHGAFESDEPQVDASGNGAEQQPVHTLTDGEPPE